MRAKLSLYASLLLIFATGVYYIREHFHAQHLELLKTFESQDKYAFATFFGKDTNAAASGDEADKYYQSVRQLAYALLHSPTSRAEGIPFLVLCTQDVLPRKRAQLGKDGATVVLVDKIASTWLHSTEPRWVDMLAKLRLFQLDEYAKICYIDADTFVSESLAGIFDDPATSPRGVLDKAEPDTAILPDHYVLAAHVDYGWYVHDYPPQDISMIGGSPMLNAGFLVLKPSQGIFEYYMALVQTPDRFDPYFMEQSLLNYAHRRDGSMPWQPLAPHWNVNWPNPRDATLGVKSFHDKFWQDDNPHLDAALKQLWQEQKTGAETFYRARDAKAS